MNANNNPRLIQIGRITLTADARLQALSVDDLRHALKFTYPEVAHADVREHTLDDGTTVVQFTPVVGRKG